MKPKRGHGVGCMRLLSEFMGTQTISFQTGPHRDGYGNPLPVNRSWPKMRPRKRITDAEICAELKEAIAELVDLECCFWACRGPQRMQSMVTCRKCFEVRRLTMLLNSLQARHSDNSDYATSRVSKS